MRKKAETRKAQLNEIKAFAAFSDRGQILYATIKANREEAETVLKRFNPPVEGHHYPFVVYPIFIGIDSGYQFSLDDTIGQGG